jgi:hypothetical protein
MRIRTFSSKDCASINPELTLTAKIFIGATWVLGVGGSACVGARARTHFARAHAYRARARACMCVCVCE